MRPRTWFLAVALSIAAPAPLLAQPAGGHAAADDQFRQGREAMNRGDYRRALELLRASHGLEPGRGKLLNIALCEEQLGLAASAARHFQEILPQLPAGDERVAIVQQHLALLGPKVPHLRVELAPAAPAGTAVKLDGEPLAATSLPAEVALDPGQHVVTATAPGAPERRYEIRASEGTRSALSVSPGPADRALPDGPASPPDDKPARPVAWTLGLAALGVGGAAVLTGVATGIAALGKRSTLVADCGPSGGDCPKNDQPVVDAYHAFGTASTATLIGGGILAVTGAILLITSPRERRLPRAWVAPEIGPGTLGLRGRF